MIVKSVRWAILLIAVTTLALWIGITAADAPRQCFGRWPNQIGDGSDEFLSGGPGRDVIDARHGDDTVIGLDNNDRLCGRGGDDRLVGGDHFDRVNGGRGEDSCEAERRRNC